MSESETPKRTSEYVSKAPSGAKLSQVSERLNSSTQKRQQELDRAWKEELTRYTKQCSDAVRKSETTITDATERISKQIRSTQSEITSLTRTMRRAVILPAILIAIVSAAIAGGSMYLAWQHTPAAVDALSGPKVIRQDGSTWIRIEPGSARSTSSDGTWAKLHGSGQN